MLERVISGGQTGVDQAAWRVAKALGIPTAGAMPLGYLTEDGPRPEFARLYGAIEMRTSSYRARTKANVELTDGTIWLGSIDPRGFVATHQAAIVPGFTFPFLICYSRNTRPSEVADWVRANEIRVLNVAGSRESRAPGIGERVERFLIEVFRRLAR
jgi:hypothetical protein